MAIECCYNCKNYTEECLKKNCDKCGKYENNNYDDENINDVMEQIKQIREETTKDGKVFTVLEKYR